MHVRILVIFVIVCSVTRTDAFGQSALSAAGGAKLLPIAPGWAGTSVNVVIFRKNSVTTHENSQVASFYDQEGRVILARRKLDSTNWDIQKTQYTGNVRDAHNSISIAFDGKGMLHMAWDHHNHPLRYARGLTELGGKQSMTGQRENRVSYPEFYNLPDDGLLFIYRDGASGSGNLVVNRYDAQTSQWRQLHANLISGQGQRNAYWQAAVDQKGTVHLSWVWRESPDVASNHDMCYARSTDGGVTWTKTTGEQYSLPITAETAEYAARIPAAHELMNQTSMTSDSQGRPYIATYWRDEGADIPQYHVIYHDGAKWQVSNVGQQTIAFRLGGGGTKRVPISRPQILADATGGVDRAYLLFRDEGRGNKVSLASCPDLSKGQWRVEDLTTGSVQMWEPTYDPITWQRDKVIHALVQQAEQGDGERVVETGPRMVYLLEHKPPVQGR